MAKIIGGIGTSHVPTIGVAYDKGKQDDPAWAPLFKGYKPVGTARYFRGDSQAPAKAQRRCWLKP